MTNQVAFKLLVILACCAPGLAPADSLPIDALPPDREVLFSRDIAPVLKKNCVACHNASNEEGGVNLESVAQMKSSEADDVLVPGKPDASRLFVLASHADEPTMPPADNDVSADTLSPLELALLRRWIESGAVVDAVTNPPSEQAWQPLSPTIKTVYSAAMTTDGRLSAVSFGNQIRLFGAKSPQPIGALEIDTGDQTVTAHDDFVQDVWIDPTGRHVVSAGFRNVKFWELAPFESTPIPKINRDDSLAIAMNASGSHLAVMSRRGELSVAEVGKDRWQWLKSFNIADEFVDEQTTKVQLSVGATGHQVAIGLGNTLRIVRIDGIEPETIEVPDAITSVLWRGWDELVTADATGHIFLWKRDGVAWAKTEHSVFDQAVMGLYSALQDPQRLVAIDVSGKVASWDETNGSFVDTGKLPAPALSAWLTPTGNALWMTTVERTLGQYSLADQQFMDVAKSDPVAQSQWAADNWQTLVGEKLVETHRKDVEQVSANVAAEQQSVEALATAIEAKMKQRDESQASRNEAKQAAETAAMKLVEAKAAEQTSEQQETDLANAVKAAEEVVAKAEQAVAAKDSELANIIAALEVATQTKLSGESRVNDLNADLKTRQQTLEQLEADQETHKSQEATSDSWREQSRASGYRLAVMAAGTRLLTRSPNSVDGTSGRWSLWSGAGDWIAELPELPVGGELVATSDHCVLIQGADGNTHALNCAPRVWQHRRTIGAARGPSPFADRVLSIDVDPAGSLLATGGGEASRSGELMIWQVADGSVVRTFERPHDDTVLCVRFSPNGKLLATGGADRMVKLWEVESGKLIKTLEGHTHHVTSVAWDVTGRQLASGSADATVKIWDLDSGQASRTIGGFKTEVTRLVFVGVDDRIAVGDGQGYLQVHRTDNGARETNAKVPGGYLYALASNRDGSQFVVGGSEGVAVVVDKSGKQLLQYGTGTQ